MRFPVQLLGVATLLVVSAASAAGQSGSFGNSAVLADDELLVAEPTTHFRPGSVYVYRNAGGEWERDGILQAHDAERADGFGTLLATAGNTLFVGQRAGPVHVFERGGDGWEHVGTVPGTGEMGVQPAEEDQEIPVGCNQYGYCETAFGISLAAEGDWLLVGEPRGEGAGEEGGGHQAPVAGELQEGAGVVHAYRREADGTWSLEDRLQPWEAASDDRFGYAVALQDGRALVGAPDRDAGDGPEGERAGGVYEFVLEGGEWRELGPLETPIHRNANIGSAVDLDGDRALVGAPGSADEHGAAYLYERDAETDRWDEVSRLASFGSQEGDRFGSAVALTGTHAWVGAPAPHGIETGRAYAYSLDPDTGLPEESRRVEITDTHEEDHFGGRVFARDGVVAVGALGMHHGAGSLHLFEEHGGGRWAESQRLLSPPDGMEPLTGEERTCPEDGEIGPFECEDVDLLAFLPPYETAHPDRARGVRMNDNWGWQDPETGREYSLVGRNDGLGIVDITDPTDPVLVGDLPRTPDTPRSQLWRDMKVYQDHVFVVADGAGNHGMQVLDLTRVRDVEDPPVTFEPDAHYDNVASVHNIHINEETGLATLVGSRGGGETCGGGPHMLDVTNPLEPEFLGCHMDQRGTHDLQCANYEGPDERYQGRELCFKANVDVLSISDMTDWDNPEVVGRASYPNPGYLHQGWLTEDHEYFIMDDEADVLEGHVETTRTLVFDVSDVEDPVLAEQFLGSFPASAHNQYVKGDFTFQANYRYGLHVLDISDPEDPEEVGYFNTTPYLSGPGFSGAWSTYPYFEDGTVVVTSVQDGMFIVRPTAPEEPVF